MSFNILLELNFPHLFPCCDPQLKVSFFPEQRRERSERRPFTSSPSFLPLRSGSFKFILSDVVCFQNLATFQLTGRQYFGPSASFLCCRRLRKFCNARVPRKRDSFCVGICDRYILRKSLKSTRAANQYSTVITFARSAPRRV